MAQHEGRAFVLDAADYRESSSLVRFFSEHDGRISLVARGVKKAKSATPGATIQPFNLVRIRYFLKDGSTIGNLATSEIERVTSAPRTSIEAYSLISYWFEVLRETSQAREAAGHIFGLTVQMVQEQETAPGLTLEYLRLLGKFCQHLGFGIDWTHCVICGQATPAPGQFSIARGGVICPNCGSHEHRGLPLRKNEVPIVAGMVNAQSPDGPSIRHETEDLFEVFGLLNRYLTYHLEHPMKTFNFVSSSIIG